MQALMGALIGAIYPPQCLTCDTLVGSDFGLCPQCWRETPFITGLVCGKCGAPVMGDPEETGVLCEDCHQTVRPWAAGRSAMLYDGTARKLVLALKHGDRMDLARPAGDWLLRAARPLIQPGMVVVPVPLHWLRMLRRRYNQAALLSASLAKAAGLDHCPDALQRPKDTGSQEGRSRDDRFTRMDAAFRLHPRRKHRIAGKPVLLVDDVMTSGATFSAAAKACLQGGASQVFTLSLCRVAKPA